MYDRGLRPRSNFAKVSSSYVYIHFSWTHLCVLHQTHFFNLGLFWFQNMKCSDGTWHLIWPCFGTFLSTRGFGCLLCVQHYQNVCIMFTHIQFLSDGKLAWSVRKHLHKLVLATTHQSHGPESLHSSWNVSFLATSDVLGIVNFVWTLPPYWVDCFFTFPNVTPNVLGIKLCLKLYWRIRKQAANCVLNCVNQSLIPCTNWFFSWDLKCALLNLKLGVKLPASVKFPSGTPRQDVVIRAATYWVSVSVRVSIHWPVWINPLHSCLPKILALDCFMPTQQRSCDQHQPVPYQRIKYD